MKAPRWLVVLTCGLACWWLAESLPVHGDLFNFEALYRDLVVLHHPISLFHFSEATFVFPDLLAMTAVRWALPNGQWAVLTYAFLFLLALAFLLGILHRRVWGAARATWAFALAFFGLVLLMSTAPLLFEVAVTPEFHGAILLLFLAWFWQLGDLMEGRVARFRAWLLFDFVTSLGFAFSDLLALPSVVLPGLVTVGWLARKRLVAPGRAGLVLVASALGAATGLLAKATLSRLGILDAASPHLLGVTMGRRLASALLLPLSLVEVVDASRVLFLAFLVCLLVFLRKRGRKGAELRVEAHPVAKRWLRLFVGFGAVVLVVKIAAIVATGRWSNLYSIRYLQEVLYLPLLWLVLWAIPEMDLSESASRRLVLVGSVLWTATLALLPHDLPLLKRPELTRCVDEHAADLPTPWGLSNFWVARVVTFTSRSRIHVNQVKLNTSQHNWESSPLWYEEDLHGRRIERTTFYIPNDGRYRERAVARWGPPSRTFSCPSQWGPLDVMIYPGGIEAAPEDRSRPD